MNLREPIRRSDAGLSTKCHEIFGEFTRCLESCRSQLFCSRDDEHCVNEVWMRKIRKRGSHLADC